MATELTWPTLKIGSTGDNVTAAQYLLTCRGFSTEVTGKFKDPTADAVSDFRRKEGLPPGRTIDSDTWDFLTNFTVDENSPSEMRDCIKAAQVELNKQKAAQPPLEVDGRFGRLTKKATIAFQHRVGGDETGGVNPPTWKNLVCRQIPS